MSETASHYPRPYLRIIFDLPAGAIPECDPCPRCGTPVSSWVADDVSEKSAWPIFDVLMSVLPPSVLEVTFQPCGHQVRATQMQDWTEHRAVDAHPAAS